MTTRRAQDQPKETQVSDIAKRARWYPNSPSSWVLKARVKDGGAVLATVRFAPWSGMFWRAGKQQGIAETLHSAFLAARKALREAAEK